MLSILNRFRPKRTPRKPEICSELEFLVEPLESRTLLSGNVSASLVGDHLVIKGDEFDNQVTLRFDNGNTVLVGQDATTINGQSTDFVVRTGSNTIEGNLLVRLRDGNDQFVIDDGISLQRSARILTGRGDDSVGIGASTIGRKLKVITYRGDDTVAMNGTTAHKVFISTHKGNDAVSIDDAQITRTLRGYTGSGDDAFVVRNSTTNRFRSHLGRGNDDLIVQDSNIAGSLKAKTKSGDDFVSIESNTIGGRNVVKTGSGDDSVQFTGNNVIAGKNKVKGGSGIDQIQLEDSTQVGRQITRRFETDTLDAAIVANRRDAAVTGALARATAAQEVLGAQQSSELALSVDFSQDVVSQSNGLLVANDPAFLIQGMTTPGAQVEIATDSDNLFNDGLTVADADGNFEFTVMLENEFDVADIQVRASDNGEQLTESASVFLATDATVRFETSLGNIDVELLAEAAPLTVRNFLNYLDRSEDLIVHRSPSNFVVQSGGFVLENGEVVDVVTDAPIDSEFDPANSNLRGTLSMALLRDQPNSGTSGWFFNTVDNAFLDANQHTVFGRVTESSLAVIDAINALPKFNLETLIQNTAFGETPLRNYTAFSETLTGTLSASADSTLLTGNGTMFTTEIPSDNQILINGQPFTVTQVLSDTSLLLATPNSTAFSDQTGNVNAVPTADNYLTIDVSRLN